MVDDGLKLSKRIYFGKDRVVSLSKHLSPMARLTTAFLPSAPMVYAVISDPGIVDNPDIPSYQPHAYGRCDPPALIPLQMNAIEMEADCYHKTASDPTAPAVPCKGATVRGFWSAARTIAFCGSRRWQRGVCRRRSWRR